ncbi:MAG TPA: hypothetical protein VI248_27690 [Kineosporiaceae bacterium]
MVSGAVTSGMFVIYAPDSASSDNPRAAVLAARLGYHGRDIQRRLRGDILVAGLEPGGLRHSHVPVGVIAAARASGLVVHTGAGRPTEPGPFPGRR